MSVEAVFVFDAKLTHVTGKKIGVYAPREIELELEKYLGRRVKVVLYVLRT